MLFLACRSVRNTLLKILVHVPVPQTWLPIAKIQNFDFYIEILSRPWKWKVGLPNNFLRYFGMYLTPPDTQNMKKKIFGVPQNFSKIALEVPWFRCRRYSETSTWYSKTSTENGLVFLGLRWCLAIPGNREPKSLHFNTRLNTQKPAPRRKKYQHSILVWLFSCSFMKKN